jgi:predicted Na+-dependent transporter
LLERIDQNLSRFLPLYVLATAGLGLWFADFGALLKSGVAPLLAAQMFVIALSMRSQTIIQALKNPRYLLIWSFWAWLVMPGISYLLGKVFLPDYPEFSAGLMLIVCLPAAITANFWTHQTKGNLALSISIVGSASLLCGLVMPPLLKMVIGSAIEEVNSWDLFINFFWTVMIPTILGVSVNELLHRKLATYRSITSIMNKALILAILFINAAVIKPELTKYGSVSVKVMLLTIMQMTILYLLIIKILPKVIKNITYEDLVAMTYTSAMRNHSAGVVIALANFGPVVAMPVIMSILIQQPMASVFSAYLKNSTVKNKFGPTSSINP